MLETIFANANEAKAIILCIGLAVGIAAFLGALGIGVGASLIPTRKRDDEASR